MGAFERLRNVGNFFRLTGAGRDDAASRKSGGGRRVTVIGSREPARRQSSRRNTQRYTQVELPERKSLGNSVRFAVTDKRSGDSSTRLEAERREALRRFRRPVDERAPGSPGARLKAERKAPLHHSGPAVDEKPRPAPVHCGRKPFKAERLKESQSTENLAKARSAVDDLLCGLEGLWD